MGVLGVEEMAFLMNIICLIVEGVSFLILFYTLIWNYFKGGRKPCTRYLAHVTRHPTGT